MTDEQWRPVVGFEGIYEVSNGGRVRSVDRTVPYADGRKPKFYKGKEVKPWNARVSGGGGIPTQQVAPDPQQRFVVGGWQRPCAVTCSRCGDSTTFVIYSDEPRDEAWCEAALAEAMEANDWRYGGYNDADNDLCDRCVRVEGER